MSALLLVAAFALPTGLAEGEPTVEFGPPVEMALGTATIAELFAADLDEDSILVAYQTAEETSATIVASVVSSLNGSVQTSTILRPSPKGTLLTDAFANGRGQGGAVLVQGGAPFVELFYNGTFLAPKALPAGPQIASSCLGASGPFVVIACEMVGLSPASVTEVYAFRLTLEGAFMGGPTPVSRLDANFSGLASVAVDQKGNAWIAIRDQIPGDLTLADVRIGVLGTSASATWGSTALGQTGYESPLPVIAVSRTVGGSAYLAFEGAGESSGSHDLQIVKIDGVSREVVTSASLPDAMVRPLKMTAVTDQGPEGDLLIAWLDSLPDDQPSTPETVVRPVTAVLRGNLSVSVRPSESPLSMGASATFVRGEGAIVGWGLGARVYPIAYHPGMAADQGLGPTISPPSYSSVVPVLVSIGIAGLVPIAIASDRASAGRVLVFAPLLNRLRAARSEGDAKRELIVEAIAASPGVHLAELGRRIGMGNGGLRHHLEYLFESGAVRPFRDGNKLRLYLSKDWEEHAATPSDLEAALLEFVQKAPGITHTELSSSLRMKPKALNYHTAPLLANGVIVVKKEDRVRKYWAAAAVPSSRPLDSDEAIEVHPSGIAAAIPPKVDSAASDDVKSLMARQDPSDPKAPKRALASDSGLVDSGSNKG